MLIWRQGPSCPPPRLPPTAPGIVALALFSSSARAPEANSVIITHSGKPNRMSFPFIRTSRPDELQIQHQLREAHQRARREDAQHRVVTTPMLRDGLLLENVGGVDGTRTRGLCRDRAAF